MLLSSCFDDACVALHCIADYECSICRLFYKELRCSLFTDHCCLKITSSLSLLQPVRHLALLRLQLSTLFPSPQAFWLYGCFIRSQPFFYCGHHLFHLSSSFPRHHTHQSQRLRLWLRLRLVNLIQLSLYAAYFNPLLNFPIALLCTVAEKGWPLFLSFVMPSSSGL